MLSDFLTNDFSTTPPKFIRRKVNVFQDNQPLQIVFPYKQFSSIARSYYCQNQACFQSYTLLSSETSSGFKPLPCPKKKWLVRGKCFIDQIQPMITAWTALILEQKFPCKCRISPIRNITLAIHRKSLTRDLNTIIYSTLQLKDNIFETSLWNSSPYWIQQTLQLDEIAHFWKQWYYLLLLKSEKKKEHFFSYVFIQPLLGFKYSVSIKSILLREV